MPTKFEQRSSQLVVTTAESLKKASEQLTQVALDMQTHGMKEALFPWTQRQWDSFDVIITLASQCLSVLPEQILAKAEKRSSKYELIDENRKLASIAKSDDR
jgi:hypothetical protein